MSTIATDLDGTIYLNNQIIPGVVDSFYELDEFNLKVIFITNNSSQTPEEISHKLGDLLSREIDINNIDISRPFEINFNKNEVIDDGFRKAFFELISFILNSTDQK